MRTRPGTHRIGPDCGRLEIRTYREGVAARVGHDLVMEVTSWNGVLEVDGDGLLSAVRVDVDGGSIEVREGVGGVKPLSDRDREEIRRNIDEKVLRGASIAFRSAVVAVAPGGESLAVRGDLTIAGTSRPLDAEVSVAGDGRAAATVGLRQSAWGITPYRGLMGTLRVRDEVDVVIEVSLPAG